MDAKIPIPENWLIKSGITNRLPSNEGIWVNDETVPILRLGAIYQALMDVPEALVGVRACNDVFLERYKIEISGTFGPFIKHVKKGNQPQLTGQLIESPEISDDVMRIYKAWVDKWAMGSEKMLVWVMGTNLFQSTLNFLGCMNNSAIRRLRNRLKELYSKLAPKSLTDNIWVWEILLSGEYRRLEETNRELARRKLQDMGFNRLRERTLIIGARYWIIIRILGYGEQEFINEHLPDKDIYNLSGILHHYDEALGVIVKSGRPFGAKTTQKNEDLDEIMDVYVRMEKE